MATNPAHLLPGLDMLRILIMGFRSGTDLCSLEFLRAYTDCSSIGQSTALSRQKLRVRALSSESYNKTPSNIHHGPSIENLCSNLLKHKTSVDDELLPYMLSNLKSYDSGA